MTGDHDDDVPGRRPGAAASDHHAFTAGTLTPAQELELARAALAERDFGHAAQHVAAALAIDPTSAEALATADELIAAAPDALALTAVEGDTHYGLAALRALTLRRLRDYDEAVALLLAVIGTCPEVPFTTWLERWLAEGLAAQLDPGDVHVAVEDALRRLDGSPYGDAPLPSLLELIARMRERHPDHERLAGSHARTLRRAGRAADAVEVARAADERAPTYFSGVILASSLRDAGEHEAALVTFRDLATRFPDEKAVHLDIGDLLLDLDRPLDAAGAYQVLLDEDPHHDWAEPSSLYARYLDSGDGAWRDRLEDVAETQSDGRARQLADAVTPYLGYLPGRPEALIQLAGQLLDGQTPEVGASGAVEIGLSSLEAPSAVRALQQLVIARGADLRLDATVPDPDPRQPRRPVAFALWAYDGIQPRPAMAPPSAAVIDPVSELALSPFHAAMWTEQARALGAELGVAAVEDLLALSVHGAPPPAGWTPWDWTFHLQVAAALTLAFVDEGWEESARQAALGSLVNGAVDWTSVAGLVAMTRLACVEPDRVADIEPLLEAAASHPTTPIHHMCLIEPAVQLMLQLPALSLPIKRVRRARRAELEAAAAE